MTKNDTNQLEEANNIRSQKRIELDNLVLEKIKKFNGLTLRQIEDLKIPIPEHLRTAKRPDKKIERKYLINSLSRLEGKAGGKQFIYSRYKEETIHGKAVKEYFYIADNRENDKTIITIPDAPELKDLMKDPYAYVYDKDTIAICPGPNNLSEIITDHAVKDIDEEVLNERNFSRLEIVETDGRNQFKLPKEIINFFKLEEDNWYFEKPSFELIKDSQVILLRIINPKDSREEKSLKQSKNILVLEDNQRFTERIKRCFKKHKHKITYTNSEDRFMEIIKKDGKTFDVISLDNKVRGKLLAEKVSPLVRYYAPNAKLGLISGQIDEERDKIFPGFRL